MKKELRRLLLILMEGNPEEIRSAKKGIDHLWHNNTGLFKKNAALVLEYLPKFDEVENAKNQAAFASGLSLFYLVLADDYFEELKSFTLEVLQNPNGHVREAIRHTSDWLFVSLTSRVNPFTYPKDKPLTRRQKKEQKVACQQFVSIVKEVEFLMGKYDDGSERVQYIDEMKPSINKSFQFFWNRLTQGRSYRLVLERAKPVSLDISGKRKEIEDELQVILKSQKNLTLENIKDKIFHENDSSELNRLILSFDTGNLPDLENTLRVLNEAWNYFPHKVLGGLCPIEKLREYERIEQTDKGLLN